MKAAKAVVILILILLGTFFLNESFIYSQNNLLVNPNWHSFKAGFFNSYAGGIESLVSRSLVAQNKIQTNINLGHQMILSKNAHRPMALKYRALIKPEGYIDIIFNYDQNQFEGIRIGRSSFYGHFHYTALRSGQFIKVIPLNFLPFNQEDFDIELLSTGGGKLNLLVNQRPIVEISSQFKLGQIGFYTSLNHLVVNGVEITDANHAKYPLSFKTPLHRLDSFYKNLLLFLIGMVVLTFIVKKLFDENYSSSIFKSALFLFLFSTLWFNFDFFYYSKLIRNWDFAHYYFTTPNSPSIDLERFRYRLFSKWNALLGGEQISKKLLLSHNVSYNHFPGIRVCQLKDCRFESPPSVVKDPNIKKILYFGASFSHHAGVEKIENGYFDVFNQSLKNHFKSSNSDYQFINFSYPGDFFIDKKEEILKSIKEFNAHYVIIGIFIRPHEFQSFKIFLDALNSEGIKALYLVPITNPESPISFYSKSPLPATDRLAQLQSMSLDEKTTEDFIEELTLLGAVWSFNNNALGSLNEFNKKGLLWWDGGHMNSYGQKLLANHNAQFFISMIEDKKKGKP